MNITLELQELDDLIVKHTAPPVTAILRNKLHPLREQMEAYVGAQEQKAAQHAQLAKEHEAFKLAQAKEPPAQPTDVINFRGVLFKNLSKGPAGVTVECATCKVALCEPPRMAAARGTGSFCPKCGFAAWFSLRSIERVIASLPK